MIKEYEIEMEFRCFSSYNKNIDEIAAKLLDKRKEKCMTKGIYKKLIANNETSEEHLMQEIMSLRDIECSDRCFANQCESGTPIININQLFSALNDLRKGFTVEKAARVYELTDSAESSWNYIKDGLCKMNDPSRSDAALKDFRNRISNAVNDDDII